MVVQRSWENLKKKPDIFLTQVDRLLKIEISKIPFQFPDNQVVLPDYLDEADFTQDK